ncbi:MAG: hypothetical protein IMZ61_11825 [Planctomycetes bacterium]|nr:hypothetical protein [Planctomycetota bacterium]
MADCIDALIDQNFVAAIKTVTTGNGYNTNINTVERTRTAICINGRYPFALVIQLEPDDVEQWANLRNDNLNYVICYFDGINDTVETVNTEFVYRMRNVHADITKALKGDVSRGGYAQNTQILRHGFGIDDASGEPFAYVVVEIARIIDPNDPYQLG